TGIGVDLFSTTEQHWGMALLVRTGPADFCKRVMGTFKANGLKAHAYGGVEVEGVEVPCPTEEEVFRLLGWPYIPPEKRALWR
ncbi:MAG: hypothetical protein Q8O76_02995, partial [Chloroflexota bacterium]|nr:hypothetical protein [Chloroflexota bacterium]